MVTKYPGAQYRPLGLQTQPRMSRYDVICLHTMVGSLYGTDSYFKINGYGGNESHFGVGHDGECFQWQDLEYTADANGNGNHRLISIETADMGPGFPKWDTKDPSQVPAWTEAQLDRLVDLVCWLCKKYNIPPVLIPNSRPEHRGIGYHRQGIQGNYPDGLVDGGEVWSYATGKVCPGDRRIAQIPTIVARARRLMGVKPPSPNRPNTPNTKEEDMGIQIIDVPPSGNIQTKRISIPVGSTSSIIKDCWISAVGNGPDKASARVWAQSDTGGIADTWLNMEFNKDKGISNRAVWKLPDGTTQLNMHLHFPNGGSLSLEWAPKPLA